MEKLLLKYAEDTLTNAELAELKIWVNSLSDEELSACLKNIWQQETGEDAPPQLIETLKKDIDARCRPQSRPTRNIRKIILRSAAIISIPLLLGIAYWSYDRLHAHTAAVTDMIVSVDAGERVNMVLPDGTRVNLNAESQLSYDIARFNRRTRAVTMHGEAYFEVARNEKIPFVIATTHLDVEVLGTTFNLSAREDENAIELDLVEGKVHLKSTNKADEAVLYARQRAVLDKASGKISVFKANPEVSTAWRRGELIFHSTPLQKVFREIERSYGVHITGELDGKFKNDLFTGTFPAGNLEEIMTILKLHYKFHFSIEGKNIRIVH